MNRHLLPICGALPVGDNAFTAARDANTAMPTYRLTQSDSALMTVNLSPTWGLNMSIGNSTLDELREVNLSYLMLCQRLLRDDKAMGMFRLGVSEQIADVLVSLTLAQTVRLASSNQLLCRFRFDDHALLSSLTHTTKSVDSASSHTAILLAGQPAEQLG